MSIAPPSAQHPVLNETGAVSNTAGQGWPPAQRGPLRPCLCPAAALAHRRGTHSAGRLRSHLLREPARPGPGAQISRTEGRTPRTRGGFVSLGGFDLCPPPRETFVLSMSLALQRPRAEPLSSVERDPPAGRESPRPPRGSRRQSQWAPGSRLSAPPNPAREGGPGERPVGPQPLSCGPWQDAR